MDFNLKILSRCFLKHYKDYIGEFGHNSQKLSELLLPNEIDFGGGRPYRLLCTGTASSELDLTVIYVPCLSCNRREVTACIPSNPRYLALRHHLGRV
jgi:hypothetical protein